MNPTPIEEGAPMGAGKFSEGANSASLRDWLAVKASEEDIKEMMMGERDYRNCRSVEYTRQQARYRHADAMLKARGGSKS